MHYRFVPSKVRAAREAAGLSQRQVAIAADVTEATISNVENGHSRTNTDLIGRIAGVLGQTVGDFYVLHHDGDGSESAPSDGQTHALQSTPENSDAPLALSTAQSSGAPNGG